MHVFLSREGYFKKITPQSLRMASEQKYKEGDGPCLQLGGHQPGRAAGLHRQAAGATRPGCQRLRRHQGQRPGGLPAHQAGHGRGGERGVGLRRRATTAGSLLFFFANGKAARVELTAYQTQTPTASKLTGAYSDKSPLVRGLPAPGGVRSWRFTPHEPRCLIFHTALLAPKTTRTTQGVAVMNLKPRYHLEDSEAPGGDVHLSTRAATGSVRVPAAGALVREEDSGGAADRTCWTKQMGSGGHWQKNSEELMASSLLGSVIFALAFDWFFAPNQMAMGGITGLAQVINALMPSVPVGVADLLAECAAVSGGLEAHRLSPAGFLPVFHGGQLPGHRRHRTLADTFPAMDPILAAVYAAAR